MSLNPSTTQQSYMIPNNQGPSFHAKENYLISTDTSLTNDQLVNLHPSKNLVDAVDYILLFAPILKNRNVDNAKQKLTELELQIQQYPDKVFDLIRSFADSYKIDLHIIAYKDGKYEIVHQDYSLEINKLNKQAFLVFQSNYEVCGPLFVHDQDGGIQTVFAADDMRINHYVDKYIEKINQPDLNCFDDIQEEQTSNIFDKDFSYMAVDNVSTLTNDSKSENPVQPENIVKFRAWGDQIIQEMYHLHKTVSSSLDEIPIGIQIPEINNSILNCTCPKMAATILQENLQLYSRVIQAVIEHIPNNEETVVSSIVAQEDNRDLPITAALGEVHHALQDIQAPPTDVASSSPTPLSSTTQATSVIYRPLSISYQHGEPEIDVQPKTEWHYRSIKDLSKNKSPLLSGDGAQRTPIRVKVPSNPTHKMFLDIAVLTRDGQDHPSKVIVPAKTKVNKDLLNHENNLHCLQFNACRKSDHFDRKTRHLHLEIDSTEHAAQLKDVRIHMFNLYQSESITKQMIEARQLNLCKLGFCLCIRIDETFQPVSSWSFSRIIHDQKQIHNESGAPRARKKQTSLPVTIQMPVQ